MNWGDMESMLSQTSWGSEGKVKRPNRELSLRKLKKEPSPRGPTTQKLKGPGH